MNADHINEHYYGDPATPQTERARRRIHWMCSQAMGRNVLDIGCSQGIVCLILGREGFHCVGIDIESASLEVARQALAKEDQIVHQRVAFQVADCSQLPFEDNSFDTVILGEVLEHFTQPLKVLLEAKRVLRDGGRVIVTVPYGLNAFPDHKYTYYPISLLRLLQPHFETQAVDTLDSYITYVGVRDPSYDPALLRRNGLFDDFVRLETALEERCLEKERAFLGLSTTLNAKIKSLSSKSAAQEARIKELETNVAASDETISELQLTISSLRQEAASKDLVWQGRLSQEESLHAAKLRAREKYFQELLVNREAEANRKSLNQRIRDLVRTVLPTDAQVLIISKGDDDLLRLDGRCASHFPQATGGVYAGYHPANSTGAIRHLETLKANGAQFLLFPATSLWWLEFYGEFAQYLETHCSLILYQGEICVIYALCAPTAKKQIFGLLACNGEVTKQTSQSEVASFGREPITSSPSLPRQERKRRSTGIDQISLGVILDEFTMGCLQPECRLVTFRPDNWRSILEKDMPDALFVESAWRGNEGAWLYRVANYQRDMGNELFDLLQWATRQGIPSIFWNKEDPVHFDRFIEHARLFSHVFTSDANCIQRYQEQLGHDRIFSLPFAAQPVIHNPIQDAPRTGAVCFAGTYYGKRHKERQDDMEYVLRPAIPFGLEIYDRQQGVTENGSDDFRFPDIYRNCIKGRLEYDEMVKAYKRYRVFLNVNSVKQSPTMFSRRVFELLACGTPVISTYSQGIVELLGDDVVFFTESESDTHQHLERLLEDEEEWALAASRGIRKVMSEHTYGQRMREVLNRIGVPLPPSAEPCITVMVRLSAEEELIRLESLLAGQSYRRFNVILVSDERIAAPAIERISNAMPVVSIRAVVGTSAEVFQRYIALAADYLAFLDMRDGYGNDYLLDYVLALRYTAADFLGKHTFYRITDTQNRQLMHSGNEFQYVDSVPSATLFAKKMALSTDQIAQALNQRVFKCADRQLLSLDRFNYLQNGSNDRVTGPVPKESTLRCLEAQV